MAGQYTVNGQTNNWTYFTTSSSSYTVGQQVRFDQASRVVSMHYLTSNSGGNGIKINATIWDMALAHGSSMLTTKLYTDANAPTNTWHEIVFDSPLVLQANKDYLFGFFIANHYTPNNGLSVGQSYSGVKTSTPAGLTATFGTSYYSSYVSEIWHPNQNANSYFPLMKIGVDTNYLPTAPTGVSVAGAVAPGGNPVASWTHNDQDSNPQSKYQIRWRKV